MSAAKETAMTTLRQLGGNRFLAMVGGKDLSFDESGTLKMRIGRNSKKVTHFAVELDRATDTYTVVFWKWMPRRLEMVELSRAVLVYAENLRDVFESNTGLYTSL